MVDERSAAEIARNYPPRKSTMVRRCTAPIIGAPDEWLFDQVTAELITFLASPGLTRDDLFTAFRDTAGAFVVPSLHNAGKGRFFRGRGAKAARRLVDADPQGWLDVLRLKDVGPDLYYDMFNLMAVRWVHRFGQCVPVFVTADGSPLDGVDSHDRVRAGDHEPGRPDGAARPRARCDGWRRRLPLGRGVRRGRREAGRSGSTYPSPRPSPGSASAPAARCGSSTTRRS